MFFQAVVAMAAAAVAAVYMLVAPEQPLLSQAGTVGMFGCIRHCYAGSSSGSVIVCGM
jgi:hypothetical protein